MSPVRVVLLVESDAGCGRALARVLRRRGHRVHIARSPRSALRLAAGQAFDLAVVDLLLPGGGVELARRLSRRVAHVYLSVGARLLADEIVELALGFPVLRKTAVPRLVGGRSPGAAGRRTTRAKAGTAALGPLLVATAGGPGRRR